MGTTSDSSLCSDLSYLPDEIRGDSLDLLDRITHHWLLQDFLKSGNVDAAIGLVGNTPADRRLFLYRSALERLENRLKLVSVYRLPIIHAYESSSFDDLSREHLLFLALKHYCR